MPEFKGPRITPELYAYVLAHHPPLPPEERALIDLTHSVLPAVANKQTAEEQAPLLSFLVRLTGARHIVEVGTFTGLSALVMARALPPGGRLISLDISEEWTAYAHEPWADAGVADRIDLRIAPALDSLRAMPAEPHIDLAFLDADKGNYIPYWEELVPRLRPGGLIVADNVLFSGDVVAERPGPMGAAVKEFNTHVAADKRMESVMITVADGLTLARRVG
ncbi:SAM-dependent methyltransferase [Streptomyces eurocidicus]|uniref:Caffeoyl-CoA O-methyltransferase n=1 Tax=Streptomyces eurocidicus TaxID=66423 RepID=A0A2N8P2D4_STREU|nr:O-methyltransferase [Streptomyces eurocidicus]MBB5121185.1 caffeoyl-CoA O-methyltransferase [Streptomyces eurocidicus]MBF6054194.1 O-methyltransferase [Streptomyces eurocidicus]PNE35177.1 SAM-dependent methyltransferase [Streptomyces eurocidicus]